MRVTILDGHPDATSLTTALCDAYARGLATGGHEVRRLAVRDLEFDPWLRGYRDRGELAPDLVRAQEAIAWCEHLTVAYPLWWGGMPALFKGFIDATFLPGWAFKFHEHDPWWDRLLAGRSARMIVTSATPTWAMQVAYWGAPLAAARSSIFAFCGFKPVRVTHLGGVTKKFRPETAQRWLARLERDAARRP